MRPADKVQGFGALWLCFAFTSKDENSIIM